MNLLGPVHLEIAILLLLAMLVIVKLRATGSLVEMPVGGWLLKLVNGFNLFFLLIVNPAAAVILLTHSLPGVDPSHLRLATGWPLYAVEALGVVLYGIGFLLMTWALIWLGRNYQLGGSAPRTRKIG